MLKRPRIDQDIHFTLNGIPIRMWLDISFPCDDRWILTPEREEDKGEKFRKVMSLVGIIFDDMTYGDKGCNVTIHDEYSSIDVVWRSSDYPLVRSLCSEDSALLNFDCDRDELDKEILAHEDLLTILSTIASIEEEHGVKVGKFQRGDGSIIEFKNVFMAASK